jgi:cytochrome c biogenesis protein CcdA
MTGPLLASLVGIAFFDSLNPSLFVAQFYLLTTLRPVPRILSYIAGVLTVNFWGGVLLAAGLGAVFTAWFNTIPPSVIYSGIVILGVGLVGFGLWSRLEPAEPTLHKPRSLGLLHTYLLGVVVMLNELTTALPYFVAIERVVQAELSTLHSLLVLALYNLVFGLPLFVFVVLFVIYGRRFTSQLAGISGWLQRWLPRLIKIGALLLGGVLVVEGAAYFLLGRGLIW